MSHADYSRREVLKFGGATAGLWALSGGLPRGADAARDADPPTFRLALASDLHFGQPGTPFAKNTAQLVAKLNEEKQERGLDAVFLNGDIVHDSTADYEELKTSYLKKLETPYYAIKGNHDFVDEQPGSPTESWEAIWGYPTNHVVSLGELAFVLADTSVSRQANRYLPADIDWLGKQLDALKDRETIFVIMHIAQRRQGVQGWPRFGVGHQEGEDTKAGEAVMRLLESCPHVKAVFHGHNHHETRWYISGDKPYFFSSHVGGSWGNKIGYRIVEVQADQSMITYQYDMQDSVRMNQFPA